MTSDNDGTAAITSAKRTQTSLLGSNIGSQNSSEERTPLGKFTSTAASSDKEINLPASARTLAPTTPPITIKSAYVPLPTNQTL